MFEVLLSSRAGGLGGNRALWFTAAGCLLGQDPLRTGPPGHRGPASLMGCPLSETLCLSSLWSLVSDLSPRPLSPSPPLSLSLVLNRPPPLSILSPLPSPSSPPLLLHILSNVDGQGHSHKDFSPPQRGFFGSVLGHSEGDAQTCRWAGSRKGQRKSGRPQLRDEQGIRG